jgi:hypothetical protein
VDDDAGHRTETVEVIGVHLEPETDAALAGDTAQADILGTTSTPTPKIQTF